VATRTGSLCADSTSARPALLAQQRTIVRLIWLLSRTRAISKSTHFGTLSAVFCSDQLDSGNATVSEDDYDEQVKTSTGGLHLAQVYNSIRWSTPRTMFPNGGWYQAELAVQVRQNFGWVDVPGVTVTPSYPLSGNAGSLLPTPSTCRTHGETESASSASPSTGYFTSINQLAVYFHAEDSPRGLRQQGRSGR